MTRKCCRTQSPDRNICSRGADTIILFASKKRCFELMLFLMVSACRRGILAALEAEAEGAGGLLKGDEVFAKPLFFSTGALGIIVQSIAFTLKMALPFSWHSCTFGWFIPSWLLKNGLVSLVLIFTKVFTWHLPCICVVVLAQARGHEQTCIDTNMWAGDICRRDITTQWKQLNLSMAGWKILWAPGGEVCSGLGLVLPWLLHAWIFALGGEQDKYVSLQHFMKQSNADIYKWDMTWSVQIVSLE